jgi:hypothetical protein
VRFKTKGKMKEIITNVLILAGIACAIVGGPAASKQEERVLVLGFESRQLNDVQDRLLRETVLYRLHTRGHAIVPVMEIEAQFQDDTKRRIRRISRADVRALCGELSAGSACYGSIAPEDGAKDDAEIRKGKTYTFHLTLYRKSDDSFTETKLRVAGRDSLYGFFTDCAAQIAEVVDRAARGR